MSILKLQDLSLSSDPSSRSDRKRRLDMPGGGNNSSTTSSGSEITIPAAPANKLGRSTSGLSLIELSPHRSTPLRPIQQRKKLCGDGCTRRKAHQCSVIISDATSDAPVTVCKLNCELGDIIQYQYPSIPSTRTRNSPLNTGRNCLDMSIKDISRSGITCLELMYKGVYSHIFLGYDNTTHRYVAVKLTNKGDHFCKRPLRNINPCYEHPHNTEEINHLKQLTHPNIIQFFKGMETNSEKKAIILEYCSNGPITRILEKTRTMSEQVSLKYFKQMFEAVKFIHHKGFAVRNIALQHFLIDDSNQVKMVDLSQLVALEEMRSDLYGIAGFQAPEVLNCRHASHHPGRVDLWSLGACLYTMVTGVRTTIHHSLGKSYKQSFSFPPAVIVGCSIRELLIGLLEYLPNHRFTLNRVEFSDWFRQPTDIVSISGFHLLSKSRKLKLGLNEFMMREYMEV